MKKYNNFNLNYQRNNVINEERLSTMKQKYIKARSFRLSISTMFKSTFIKNYD